ncbi:alkaline phosphatase [Gordoniibacillus kamchatkensis]|uniref:Alkaline phosphatase n=1 Tax=Gordoniibacillus kamchatkensis TaxID=1590651 RepID=A0ABR5AK04_9BACL|nr:VTT domain-containing protein [Paenibacillus sp. VKM B-2647]KIL41349.1 alkaline phosphatase [Paenibacillus sp. VKM B-2647]
MGHITAWLEHYGYIVLFLSLMLELIAFGIPTEVLMSYAGFLVYQGKLGWLPSILVSGLGSVTGITISYWIGFKLGTPFFHKYGHKLHMGPERIEKTSKWFGKYGNKLLIVAYFIPGIRHITGYFSGITKLPFPAFALYAYIGAFLWTATFITLGKVLGPKWEQFHSSMNKYLIIGGIIAAVILSCVYLYKRFKPNLYEKSSTILNRSVETFHSWGRVRFLLVFASLAFLGLFSLMLGLIQDMLAHEFTDFDTVTLFIVHTLFDESWSPLMNRFALLGTYWVFTPLLACTCIWIMFKGKDRLLELSFLFFVVIGGEAWDEGLRMLFHRSGPMPSHAHVPYTFPSEHTLITLIVCGFTAFLLVRHHARTWVRFIATLMVLAVAFLVGVSRIYFEIQYPSDVAAGYVFGGVWVTLNIVLLEIFRLLRHHARSEEVHR